MGTVRELRSRFETSEHCGIEHLVIEHPVIRLVVLDDTTDAKVIHFHRVRTERRPVRILHPSMMSDGSFPWDPDRTRQGEPAPDRSHDER